LIIQCLFFADGGLLAYGCNVFNMGITACFIAYPLIFKPIVSRGLSKVRLSVASIAAVVIGLQVGAFCVVLQTLFSGVSELPFATFLLLMQPIHLAIGLVEGLVTAAVLCYVHSARPELLDCAEKSTAPVPIKKILVAFGVLTLVVAGGLSIFASQYPDGLEWSMEKIAGTTELEREGGVYESAAVAVEKTAFMPDYNFKSDGEDEGSALGTSAAGIVGSLITVLLAAGIGFIIYMFRKRRREKSVAA
jgi:cobalt/nickel transport system permease protein